MEARQRPRATSRARVDAGDSGATARPARGVSLSFYAAQDRGAVGVTRREGSHRGVHVPETGKAGPDRMEGTERRSTISEARHRSGDIRKGTAKAVPFLCTELDIRVVQCLNCSRTL